MPLPLGRWEVPTALCPQVPGPLTQEMEAKKLEKKRAQKAQRKQREQAQREERQRWEQEQREKQQFAALSDREKVRPCVGKGVQPGWDSAAAVSTAAPRGGVLSCLCSPEGPGCRVEAGCTAAGHHHHSYQHQVTAPAAALHRHIPCQHSSSLPSLLQFSSSVESYSCSLSSQQCLCNNLLSLTRLP